MRIGTIVSLGASAALGLGALVVARVWLPAHSARTSAAATTQGVPVVVAASPIAYGTKLEAKNLAVAILPADAAPVGAFASVDQVMKQDAGGAPVALTAISQKEPVLAAKLSGAGVKPTLAALIGPGMRAYTIGVTETAGVGGHALPGDRVDVVLTRDNSTTPTMDGGHGAHLVSDVVIQNVRLLGVDMNADPTATKLPVAPHTATLEVSVQDAERLAVAAQAGTLSLALRRTGAAEIEAIRPMLTSDLGPTGPAAGPMERPAASLTRVRRRAVVRPRASVPPPRAASVIVVHGEKTENVSVPVAAFGAGV